MFTLTRFALSSVLFAACCGCNFSNKDASPNTSTDTPKKEAAIAAADVAGEKPEPEMDCVFDTSTFKFTTEKLTKFRKGIVYFWDNTEKEAVVRMENNDTLRVHIGGCDHFSYSAIYTTDAVKFTDMDYLITKAHWLAKNFMDIGFDEKFTSAIEQKQYTLDSTSQPGYRSLTIIDKDTAITDHIYEPVTFRTENNRTVISVLGYVN